jgi:hypothetical protein
LNIYDKDISLFSNTKVYKTRNILGTEEEKDSSLGTLAEYQRSITREYVLA